MTTKLDWSQITGTPGTFYSNAAQPYASSISQPGRAFIGEAFAHQGLTDRNAASNTSVDLPVPPAVPSFPFEVSFAFTANVANFSYWTVGGSVVAVVTAVPTGHPDEYVPRRNYVKGTVKSITLSGIVITVTEMGGDGGVFNSWEVSFIDPKNGWSDFFLVGGAAITGWDYFMDQARLGVLSSFGIGVGVLVRASGGGSPIGYAAGVLGDKEGVSAWAGYFDAVRTVDGTTGVMALELEIGNAASSRPHGGITPYKSSETDITYGIGIGSGSDRRVFGRSFAADAAINTGNNGAAFWTGWNVAHNAIMREFTPDDRSPPNWDQGFAPVISMAYDQGFRWYSRDPIPGGSVRPDVFRFTVNVTDPAVLSSIYANNGGFGYRERSGAGHDLFSVAYRSDAGANVRVEAAAIGGSPAMRAVGVNADINLTLGGKGNGTVALAGLREFANDTAAAAGGVPINGLYLNGNDPKIRRT